ncbi:MAG: ATP-binding protein [Roseovarius sp.]|nr:ATP-binding protein [Roseovarius sp.]
MTKDTPAALSPDRLRWQCDADAMPDVAGPKTGSDEPVGQARAIDALRLSVDMSHKDFNLFVLGPTGTGRHTAVERILHEYAERRERPSDWVYVNNFDTPHRPVAMRLPSGTAKRFSAEMQGVVDDLASDIPAFFESEEYQTQRRALDEEFGSRQEEAMAQFAERARKAGVAVLRTPMGYMVAAMRDGEVIKTEEYQKLPKEEQEAIDEKISRFQDDLAKVLGRAPKLAREHRSRLETLNAEMAERAVSARISEARERFADIDQIVEYLEQVRTDMITNAELFLQSSRSGNDGPFPASTAKSHGDPAFHRYMVNVMVAPADGAEARAPVETEELPTLDRLAGRIEHISHMGSLVTDFTLIRPGVLHRANGGFLLLDARRVLSEPFAWDALKRCLRRQAITITSMAERMSLVSTTSLEPDPIPLDVRVVLIGDRLTHALLLMLDPDFSQLFKVQSDFEESVDRDDETALELAQSIRRDVAARDLLPPDKGGLARLLTEAARISDDARKLSLRLDMLSDIFREAEYYARGRGAEAVGAVDMDRAVAERERRAARVRDRMHEAIERRTILIDTEGQKVGQINGLSVISLGDYRFGRPSRITARTRLGAGKLIDIEREVELGGPIHSKGVMILSGYLSATFALDMPFSLHATLVFEQSYGGVDGDSASCAELLALLSALSNRPLRQDFAVTGSVNQLGEVQAIGGVNEKIEGFFDVCAARGLTGEQGVLVPAANVEHLMLRDRVVEAAKAGRFRVIPVRTVDAALEVLTGRPAGVRGEDGAFEKDSINALVEARLEGFAKARRAFVDRKSAPGTGDAS